MARCPFKIANKHLLAMEVCECSAQRCVSTGNTRVQTKAHTDTQRRVFSRTRKFAHTQEVMNALILKF